MASNSPIAHTVAPRLSKYFGRNRIHSSSAKPMDTSATSRMAVFRFRARKEVRLLAKEGEDIGPRVSTPWRCAQRRSQAGSGTTGSCLGAVIRGHYLVSNLK